MWMRRLLQVFNFNRRPNVKKMEEETNFTVQDHGGEDDWLAERPENWYQGPLDLSFHFEEGT